MDLLWEIFYVAYLAIPLSNGYSDFSFLVIAYGISYLDILFWFYTLILFTIRFKVLISKKFHIIPFIVICLVVLFSFYGLYIGYNKYGYSALNDFIKYCKISIVLIASLLYKNKITINRYLKLTTIGLICNIVLSSIVHINDLFLSRVGTSCFSLFIVVIGMSALSIINGNNRNKQYFIFIFFIVSAILSQNRTYIVLAVMAFLLGIIILNKTKKTKIAFFNSIIILLLCIIVFIILFYFNIPFINRIIYGEELNTGQARANTFLYYYEIAKNSIFGEGFGYIMHFVTSNGYVLPSQTFQIDNAFIVFALKAGFPYAFLQLILILSPTIYLYKNKDIYSKQFLFCYILLFVSSSIMTSQVIHSSSIVMFTWSTVGLCMNNKLIFPKSCKNDCEVLNVEKVNCSYYTK